MSIGINTNYSTSIYGKVQKLVEEKYIQKIKNAYLSNSDKVEDMSNEDYRVAGYVEELDRFLSKASGGNTRVDDLSIETKQGAYSTSSNYIAGLPGNVADLINNSDAVSKYYDYKNMLYEVLTYKQHYGTVPRYNVQTSINQGTFGYM